jgi:hypothetical protein
MNNLLQAHTARIVPDLESGTILQALVLASSFAESR